MHTYLHRPVHIDRDLERGPAAEKPAQGLRKERERCFVRGLCLINNRVRIVEVPRGNYCVADAEYAEKILNGSGLGAATVVVLEQAAVIKI